MDALQRLVSVTSVPAEDGLPVSAKEVGDVSPGTGDGTFSVTTFSPPVPLTAFPL